MTQNKQTLEAIVPDELAGMRIDQVLSRLFDDFSRSRLTSWIKQGQLTVDGKQAKPKDRILGGEHLQLLVTIQQQVDDLPEAIPLNIVYDDDDIVVINKPAGLVVHPAAGNHSGTLLNALLYHYPGQKQLPRAGIVHRLDKDTTGLMVVAKSSRAHVSLVDQLQQRTMGREYTAIVSGVLTGGGCVDEPIGRHPAHRTKMAVHPMGKPAVTHYRVKERFNAHTLLDIKLETGRTHQIRVHMSYLHYPLVGDKVYAGRARVPAGVSEVLKEAVRQFPRQALHARKLTLHHPESNQVLSWDVPVPDDMAVLIQVLRQEYNATDN